MRVQGFGVTGGENMEMDFGKKGPAVRRGTCLLWGLVCLVVLTAPQHSAQEVFAQTEKAGEKENAEGSVLNRFGRVVGSVDANGDIFNRFGHALGSVEADGTVFNVSEIVIGQVKPNGDVLNQSGTVLGSVNANGEVFNRSGRMVGSVNAPGSIVLIGGAARLLLL
jgi:hypothetical protein